MKAALLLFVLITGTVLGLAQSPVNRLIDELSYQSTGTLATWRYSESFAGDPTSSGFDDHAWPALTINQSLRIDSCWIRKEIILPSAFLGIPVQGKIRLLLTVDDYAYLWINGKSMGKVNWDGEYDLTASARPGAAFPCRTQGHQHGRAPAACARAASHRTCRYICHNRGRYCPQPAGWPETALEGHLSDKRTTTVRSRD